MPNDSTRSRSRFSPSTDHFSSNFADGSVLQILFTPNAARTFRTSSVVLCWVPTFIRPGLDSADWPRGAAAAAAATWINRLRFIFMLQRLIIILLTVAAMALVDAPEKVILDTDSGPFNDDGVALVLLLQSSSNGSVLA